MTIGKVNHQLEKLSQNKNQSDILLRRPEDNCRAYLKAKFTTIKKTIQSVSITSNFLKQIFLQWCNGGHALDTIAPPLKKNALF